MYIVLFPLVAPDNLFWGGGGGCGVGWRGQKYKKPKIADFCHFCSCKGVCEGRASNQGRAKCPHTPMSPLPLFPGKHQTQHNLSLANCMHGNEMIIVDSLCMIF